MSETSPTHLTTVELGDGIIDVTFLRGMAADEPGWWCMRRGVNFEYDAISFFPGKDAPRWAFKISTLPTPSNAADAVHLSFNGDTCEGLSCAKATKENVAVKCRMGRDAIEYRVIARRTRTERRASAGTSEVRH